jgi:hypothetical protein
MATSNGAAHRGQRCPGDTRARFPKISITAGTVWVQIGQCANPLTPFSTIGFIAFTSHHIGRKNRRRGSANLQTFSKQTKPRPPAPNPWPPRETMSL